MFERIERLIAAEEVLLVLIIATGSTLAAGQLTAAGFLLMFTLIAGKQRGDRRAAVVAARLASLDDRVPDPSIYEDTFAGLSVRKRRPAGHS
jgi:hypothetical protein